MLNEHYYYTIILEIVPEPLYCINLNHKTSGFERIVSVPDSAYPVTLTIHVLNLIPALNHETGKKIPVSDVSYNKN